MLALVVDDEEDIINLLRSLLQSKGFEVLSARNGREALDRLRVAKADIIVSDIYMPVMDGIRLHDAVRSDPSFSKIPFLFISGYDDMYTAGAVRDPRLEGFWRKGSHVRDLIRWVDFLVLPEAQRAISRPDGVTIPPHIN